MSSNSSSGGASRSPTKKSKQKKVPQRGLGVAQLEKIRMEEQQKKDASNTINISSASSTTLSRTNSLSAPSGSLSSYTQTNRPKSPIPFRTSSSPSGLSSSNNILRTCSTTNFENFNFSSTPQMPLDYLGGFDVGWPLIPTNEEVNVSLPLLWQPYEFNLDRKGDNSPYESFRPSFNLPYESCPIDPLLDGVPRTQNYQQRSSLVNVSSMGSSLSSSVSTKSYYSNNSPWWPAEEKMVIGMKRPRPFFFDDPSIPNFNGKLAASGTQFTSRSVLSPSCRDEGKTFDFDTTIPIFRELPLCSTVIHEPTSSKKSSTSQNRTYNGKILSLAPVASPFPNARLKQSPTFSASHRQELCNFKSLPYQGIVEDVAIDSVKCGATQQPKFFSLFPTTKVQVAPLTTPTWHHSFSCERRESIDLNLRL